MLIFEEGFPAIEFSGSLLDNQLGKVIF